MKVRPNNTLALILIFAIFPFFVRATDHTVEIDTDTYSPSDLTINVGDTVIWENIDIIGHEVISDNGAFPNSGLILDGDSYSYTFPAVGDYPYHDRIVATGIIHVIDGGTGGNIPPTVRITSPADGTVFNLSATFTITATATDTDGIANVDFFKDGVFFRRDTTASYTATVTNLSPGTYIFSAVATDTLGASSTNSISITVNAAPTVSIVSPASNTMFTSPASFVIQADASDPEGRLDSVEFFRGSTLIGIATAPPYTFDVNGLNSGTYTFSAVAVDDEGLTASSSITIIVNALPSVTMLTPTNGAAFSSPYKGLIQASAVDGDGSITNVEFFIGTNSIGNATRSPYVVLAPNLGQGSYTVKATATDNRGGTTTSAGVNFTVFTRTTLSSVLRTNGQTRFNITGVAGQVYIIEASTNLTSWSAISTNTAPSATFPFTDTSTTVPKRFYRVRN